MNKYMMLLLLTALLSISLCEQSISTALPNDEPFQGRFGGILTGERNSSASITLDLDQNGTRVTGKAIVGGGLLVYADRIRSNRITAIPSSSIDIVGRSDLVNARHLQTDLLLSGSGLPLGMAFVDIPRDAEDKTIYVCIKLDIPLICRGSTVNATLNRLDLN